MSRDWTKTLWPASFRGVPFWVERDNMTTGRRLSVVEFPGADTPFIEDLGGASTPIEITGYLLGDSSDAQIAALEQACFTQGAATLVLPAQGPVQARCEHIKRDRLRDKAGRFGFEAKFVIDGTAPAASSSVPEYQAQLTFDAGQGVVAAAGSFLAGASVVDYPNWVADNVVTATQDAVAGLETIYSQNGVDPAKAAAVKLAVAATPALSPTSLAATTNVSGLYAGLVALYNSAPVAVSGVTGVDPSLASGLVNIAAALGGAMDPAAAASAFAAAADNYPDVAPAPAGATANRAADAANMQLVARLARLAFLNAYAQALVAQTYETRQDAITARADCVVRFDRELELCSSPDDIAVAQAMIGLRDATVAYLSLAIINAKPVLTVTTPSEWPVLMAAWRLYQDPTRAPDLLTRNAVPTAEFLGASFEALAD